MRRLGIIGLVGLCGSLHAQAFVGAFLEGPGIASPLALSYDQPSWQVFNHAGMSSGKQAWSFSGMYTKVPLMDQTIAGASGWRWIGTDWGLSGGWISLTTRNIPIVDEYGNVLGEEKAGLQVMGMGISRRFSSWTVGGNLKAFYRNLIADHAWGWTVDIGVQYDAQDWRTGAYVDHGIGQLRWMKGHYEETFHPRMGVWMEERIGERWTVFVDVYRWESFWGGLLQVQWSPHPLMEIVAGWRKSSGWLSRVGFHLRPVQVDLAYFNNPLGSPSLGVMLTWSETTRAEKRRYENRLLIPSPRSSPPPERPSPSKSRKKKDCSEAQTLTEYFKCLEETGQTP